ncbi:MAG: recombinase family protein, partial [Pseudomonadota bacterium]
MPKHPEPPPQEAHHHPAVIYCRVSSVAQVQDGHGLESQATRCREYAARKGYTVVETFHEKAVSGGLMERPAFTAMLAFIRRHADTGMVVVIDDISRFARDIESHWALRRTLTDMGGRLESPSLTFGEDSDSVLIENLLASVSQHQRQKNGEQTRNRMRARALNGYWCFHAPVGYRYERRPGHGKVLVRDEPIATILAGVLKGFASGRLQSQAEVRRALEAEPAFAARYPSGTVRYEEIHRILTRVHYAGHLEVPDWDVSLRKAQHEGLITLAEFQRIQERIREGARVPARPDIDADFPLRGAVACASCNKPLTACWSTSKTGKKHPYYMCFAKGCPDYRKSIRRDRLEDDFQALLATLQPTEPALAVARAMFTDIWQQRLDQAKALASGAKRQAAKLERQIEQLLDRIIAADSPAVISAYETRIAILEREKLIWTEKAANQGQPKRPFDEVFELAMTFLSNPW